MPTRVKREYIANASVRHDSDAETDEDDPVEREIDVYLSPALAEHLYLLQFPLHYNEMGNPSEARIKRRHGILEIDYEQPAFPHRPAESSSFQEQHDSSWMQKRRTFESQTIPVETHMCLGHLKDTNGQLALHIVPLQHIDQMRPSFRHLREEKKQEEDGEPDRSDEANERKPVVFQRKESERAAVARRSSYAYKKASEEAEEWQTLQIFGKGSNGWNKYMDKASCATRAHSVLASQASSPDDVEKNYIESLDYMNGTRTDSSLPMVSDSHIKSVVAKVTSLLRNGWPVPFSVIRGQYLEDASLENLLAALSVCAVMVRGNFCLHSRYLSLSKPLQRARTFVLLLLDKWGHVRRKHLEKVFEGDSVVSSEKLHLLLVQVGKRTEKGWELNVDDDTRFMESYPNQLEMFQHFWEHQSKSKHMSRLLQRYEELQILEGRAS